MYPTIIYYDDMGNTLFTTHGPVPSKGDVVRHGPYLRVVSSVNWNYGGDPVSLFNVIIIITDI